MLSFFPGDVLDEILYLIESVSEGFPTFLFQYNPGDHKPVPSAVNRYFTLQLYDMLLLNYHLLSVT